LHADIPWLVLLTAVTAFLISLAVWSATTVDALWGGVALAGALTYAVAAVALHRQGNAASLPSAHAVSAAALAALGSIFLFDNDMMIVSWAVEAVILHALGRRFASGGPDTGRGLVPSLTGAAYVLSTIVGFALLQRLAEGGLPETPILNARAAADAAVIAVSLVGTKWVTPKAAPWFWVIAHVAVLAWLARELSALSGGDGLVTAAWGIYALGLLFFMRTARKVALATLFLAVGKLVLHDMSQVEPIWRILLFMSFGAVFLAISYYFTDLLGGTEPDGEARDQ
jgi:hypothetical protein